MEAESTSMKANTFKRRNSGPKKTFRKRPFRGNQFTKTKDKTLESLLPTLDENVFLSASSRKLKSVMSSPEYINATPPSTTITTPPHEPVPVNDNDSAATANIFNTPLHDTQSPVNIDNVNDVNTSSINLLIDSSILSSILSLVACCPDCQSRDIAVEIDLEKKKGLSVLLDVCCNKCGWTHQSYTSKTVGPNIHGAKSFEINTRSVIAMREIGRGHASLEKFCGYMNIPPPMRKNAFLENQKKISAGYKTIAEKYMNDAANELRNVSDSVDLNNVEDATVSCDGTWQRRGYSSLHGVVTVIAADTGKCLDYRVKSKVCHECSHWEKRKGTDEYEEFISKHECSINHDGSAGSMEAAGLVNCFVLSEKDRKLRYKYYIGDGDSKSHHDIVKKDPYNGIVIQKLECVGHIQKRVGGRLRKMKATNKTKLSDGNVLGGKGHLTEKVINKLQNYYGIAIRQCTGTTVYAMKKAVGAVLFHCSDARDPETRHRMCPRSADSWCKFQSDKINNTQTYVDKPGIPTVVCDFIKPIFSDLSDENLLKRFLHGKTQNTNEFERGDMEALSERYFCL